MLRIFKSGNFFLAHPVFTNLTAATFSSPIFMFFAKTETVFLLVLIKSSVLFINMLPLNAEHRFQIFKKLGVKFYDLFL